jgi:coproporphyrinogen III oxidase-like Fe-S oxidoreductase
MGDTGSMTTPMSEDLAALREHELRALATRYDVPGPRYTSYPALPDWSGSFGPAEWEAHLQQLAAPDASVALYVHLPFCVARCLYCGCNATVTTRDEVVDRYLARLAREIAWAASAIGARPAISAMHWGGGTPNFPSLPQLERLVGDLHSAFDLNENTERSIEAGLHPHQFWRAGSRRRRTAGHRPRAARVAGARCRGHGARRRLHRHQR